MPYSAYPTLAILLRFIAFRFSIIRPYGVFFFFAVIRRNSVSSLSFRFPGQIDVQCVPSFIN